MSARAPEIGNFKGSPTITIFTGRRWTGQDGEEREESITMGVRKAAAICDYIDSLRQFVEKNQK